MAYIAKAKFSRRSVACPVSLDERILENGRPIQVAEPTFAHPAFRNQPWWVVALEGELCWKRLLRELGFEEEPHWCKICWEDRSLYYADQPHTWQCKLVWSDGKGPHRRMRTKFVRKALWPLALKAAVYLQCRHKLEGLLGA